MKNKIDIIIPCYKAQGTLFRCLSSIGSQTVFRDIKVTLVADCDGVDYSPFLDTLEDLDIQIVRLEKNLGPGGARDAGIKCTENPLLMFMDADDTFASPYAVETLRDALLKEDFNVMVNSTFLEEQGDLFISHERDMVWMFGKIYKRSFIDKYGIHFQEGQRCNEDMAFNKQCIFFSNENEKIKSIANVTYYWMEKKDSITRVNDYEYYYKDSFWSMLDGWVYSIKYCLSKGANKEKIEEFIKESIGTAYAYYIQIEERRPEFVEKAWEYCVKYYKEVFSIVRDKITLKEFCKSYENAMKKAFNANKMFDCMPNTSFREFVRKLDKYLEK